MSRRVWKLQDFVAHSGGRIHCARLGEKSGQVLATGGDDKRVNIWKVGKPSAMMSLTGHTSSVECVVFNKEEEILVVGCGGGSMQIWNLEYRRMSGTLAGHRTACNSVEFHPYGEFFASGSADTNLKIWDMRHKHCIQTYKGHTGAITSIRFSPHGRWVATGGQDSQVKLWDLTAGKLMKDLDHHRGAITSLAYHPKEMIMATGSADRTMKLWSLETFKSVGTTEPGSSAVQAVKFYVEEQSVLCASQDALRVYPLDNLSVPQDSIDVDWRGLQDMRLCSPEEKLIAISTDQAQIGIWVADLQRRDLLGKVGGGGRSHPRQGGVGNAGRAGPVRQATNAREKAQVDAEPETVEWYNSDATDLVGTDSQGTPPASPRARVEAVLPLARGNSVVSEEGLAGPGNTVDWHFVGEPPPVAIDRPNGSQVVRAGSPDVVQERGEPEVPTPLASAVSGMPRPRSPGDEPGSTIPGAASPPASVPSPPVRDPLARDLPARDPLDQVAQMQQQHTQMMGILHRRLAQVRRLKEFWDNGNMSRMPTVAQDPAPVCDLLRAVMQRELVGTVNLDACQVMLPILRDQSESKYDEFATASLQFILLLLQRFGDLITDTRQGCAGIPVRQLDFAREERLRKCNACHELFQEIHRSLAKSRVAGQFGGLRDALQSFLHRA